MVRAETSARRPRASPARKPRPVIRGRGNPNPSSSGEALPRPEDPRSAT
ncbi:hypothetical protein BV133_266 [Blastochloris viridis]|uniref:Uncharacterized protein n=1 Tax=Blastochloris viridis TaxID=1079 RepID=A0A182CXH4_BLAVI|nr:hypothetical protein BV133_266 [Blastochloris viridis]